MGWTSYHATYYKGHQVDRKKELDSYWEGNSTNAYTVLKSKMVGSTYYAAIQKNKCLVKDSKGIEHYEELEEKPVFAAIFLTQVNSKDYYNFAYKDMDESYGPCNCNCPKNILNLLTPTSNEYALQWRKRCLEQLKKKEDPDSLKNLPIDSVIEVTMPCDSRFFKEGQVVKLTKYKKANNRTCWLCNNIRFTGPTMKFIENEGCYTIIKRGA